MGCPEQNRGQVNLRMMNKSRKLQILHRHFTVGRYNTVQHMDYGTLHLTTLHYGTLHLTTLPYGALVVDHYRSSAPPSWLSLPSLPIWLTRDKQLQPLIPILA